MDLKEKRAYFEINVDERPLLNFQEIFGNENTVYLEIGSGKGEFIAYRSLVNYDTNFVGIEIKNNRVDSICRKLDVARHTNVKLMRLFVDANVTEVIPEKSIKRIFINHPDPWPKTKHHKNRLINDKFIDTLNKILKLRGVVEIITDHVGYAQWIIDHFKVREDFISEYPEGFSKIPKMGHIVTYFEEVKRKEGWEPIFMKFRKVEHYDKLGKTEGNIPGNPETAGQ